MKKLGLLAMAFAMVMTLSQCKKDDTTTPANEGEKVFVTLNVGGGNGSKVAVEPETGVVTFENGDVLYVTSNGTYVGALTYDGTNFAGEITEPTEGQKLHFYFLGNVAPEETLTEGTSTGCSVVINDQTEHLPVISYAPSRENFQVGKTDYNATLLNKCALAKFDVTTVSEAPTCILGMNNKVTVDFTDNNFTYGQEEDGVITLAAGSGERWAILLPQNWVTTPGVCSLDGLYVGISSNVPGILENGYLTEGISVTVNIPKGALNGFFTINGNGDQVYFSQGNLQYNMTTNEWSFMEHQYDVVGTVGMIEIEEDYADQDIVSLFGWGTSGYNHRASCYQPWSTSGYYFHYAYGPYTNNLYDGNGQADWGYNAIINGGNTENSGWRTLTEPEWEYVLHARPTASGFRYVQATVNGMAGVMLLPDNWSSSIYELSYAIGEYSSNTITAEDWTDILEPNGAVFLPAAGFREDTDIRDVGYVGLYWSASKYRPNYLNSAAFGVWFCEDDYVWDDFITGCRGGCSVRLVRDVE